MNMLIHFLCLCPLRLAIMLNFNKSKVAYSERSSVDNTRISEISYQNENFIRNEIRNDLYVASISNKEIQRNIWRWNDLVPE